MRCNSYIFLVFLLAVVSVLWLLPARFRKFWLLFASFVFYASWGAPMLGLLIGASTFNYWGARWIVRVENRRPRGALIIGGNVALLAVFKYLGWLCQNINELLLLAGQAARVPVPDLPVPLGISFYLFESISYIADITRGREKPRSFVDLQLFIAFFPKLIAGPILRGREFFQQLALAHTPDADAIRFALRQIAIGLFFKIVLVDRATSGLAVSVDEAFSRPYWQATSADAWLMSLAFSIQLYLDFSAYTRIALGSAKLCGIALVENFNYPFMSTTPGEFWQRWHMSLSRWVRDYLFFPLQGGLEGASRVRSAWAAFVSMLVFGVWHGAGWNFVAFGVYQGCILAAYHLLAPRISRSLGDGLGARWLRKLGGWVITVGLFCLGALLWRCREIDAALGLLQRAVMPWDYPGVHLPRAFVAKTLQFYALVMVAGLVHVFAKSREAELGQVRRYALATFEGVLLGTVLLMSFVHMKWSSGFVYFQF